MSSDDLGIKENFYDKFSFFLKHLLRLIFLPHWNKWRMFIKMNFSSSSFLCCDMHSLRTINFLLLWDDDKNAIFSFVFLKKYHAFGNEHLIYNSSIVLWWWSIFLSTIVDFNYVTFITLFFVFFKIIIFLFLINPLLKKIEIKQN